MHEIPLGALFGLLVALIAISAFFSGSETALMTLNRYRLRHLARSGQRGARLADRLLQRPDRLIGLLLLGNNFANIMASSVATVIALRLGGEGAIAISTGLLTLVVLIFAEVAPKTLAALHPERLAFPTSFVLTPLLRFCYPLVWTVNCIVNAMLRLMGAHPEAASTSSLSREELRVVVNEAGAMIPHRHQKMLLNILDLEKVEVDDIMVPRSEIVGIDLDDSWDKIIEQIAGSQYTRIPVYQGSIDDVRGLLHVRQVLTSVLRSTLTREELSANLDEPYFIPEGTPLPVQLLNFQAKRWRIGLVVDEYGEIRGLITLEDILEEIVGEFTTDPGDAVQDVYPQADGSFLVDGSASVRELNRLLKWNMPTNGPKTLNGLILEHLEAIPEPGTSLLLDDYPVTIIQTQRHKVKMARIQPRRRRMKRQIQ